MIYDSLFEGYITFEDKIYSNNKKDYERIWCKIPLQKFYGQSETLYNKELRDIYLVKKIEKL